MDQSDVWVGGIFAPKVNAGEAVSVLEMVADKVYATRTGRVLRYRYFFFFQAEDGIRDYKVTGVQTCALPISGARSPVLKFVGFRSVVGRITLAFAVVLPTGGPASLVIWGAGPPDCPRPRSEIGRASCRERV